MAQEKTCSFFRKKRLIPNMDLQIPRKKKKKKNNNETSWEKKKKQITKCAL